MLGELPRNQIENAYELSSFQVGSDLYSDHIFQNFGGKVCMCICMCQSELRLRYFAKFCIFIDAELLSPAMVILFFFIYLLPKNCIQFKYSLI